MAFGTARQLPALTAGSWSAYARSRVAGFIADWRDDADKVLPPKLAAGVAGALLVASGALAIAEGTLLAADPIVNRELWAFNAALTIGGGLCVMALPWHRWPSFVGLSIPIFGFVANMLGDIADPDPYRYSPFFMLCFLWTGLAQPRGSSLLLMPFFAISYVAPLVMQGASGDAQSSVVDVGVIYILGGETVAWVASRLRRTQQALGRQRSEARFRSLVQHASDLTTIVQADGQIRYQSPSIEGLTGHTSESLVGRQLADFAHPDDVTHLLAFLEDSSHRPRSRTQLEWRLAGLAGAWVHVETTATNLLDDAEVDGIVLNTRDVSDRKALEEQLRHQAFHDPLTELANRALFRDHVENGLARARWRQEATAVLYLDIDNFKTVNDSLGHTAGDLLLRKFAIVLRECVRAGDTVARTGGDEFAILLEDATGEHSPEQVAERIAAALRTPLQIAGRDVIVSTSIGITDAVESPGGADELLRNADVALHAAKGAGKARAERFEKEMYASVRRRLDLTADLRRALDRGEFRLVYQPIVNLATGRISEVEALVRWMHPVRGLVMPADFIPVAEDTGMIVPLGRWVLAEACRQASTWHALQPGRQQLVIGVNLSARQFADPHLVEDVAYTLRETGLRPSTLKLEITESVAMKDTAAAEAIMHALKRLGVKLAIDDFGTGYSSLHYLKRFPVDTLKIDRSFIDGLGADEQDTAIVQSVVALAKTLRLETTAEGIETTIQQSQLRVLHVEHGQGYLFARPLPAEELTIRWLGMEPEVQLRAA